jgi:hypothetical protein
MRNCTTGQLPLAQARWKGVSPVRSDLHGRKGEGNVVSKSAGCAADNIYGSTRKDWRRRS